MNAKNGLMLMHLHEQTPSTIIATVTVEKPYVDTVYQEALRQQRQDARIQGFLQGDTPLNYLEKTYKAPLMNHLQEFFLSSCVSTYLMNQLAHHKIVMVGEPRLQAITMDPQTDASFTFEVTTARPKINHDWDRISFRAPARKNYRDLDKQVELFIKEETEQPTPAANGIKIGDWISFSLQPISASSTELLGSYKDILWLKIGDEEADEEAQALFVGKKVGDTFTSKANFLQCYVSNSFDACYMFTITILNHVADALFSLPLFKQHFHLKTTRDVHLKLIEVFSCRQDLSQRRETVELALKALTRHHHVPIPESLIANKQQEILEAVYLNPDYYVYKAQPDFKEKVHMLAEKQLKELALIDALGYQENINPTKDDILSYLNLMKRPRTREFIYFTLPSTKTHGQELPVSHETIRKQCMREKTLNHVITKLMKQKI